MVSLIQDLINFLNVNNDQMNNIILHKVDVWQDPNSPMNIQSIDDEIYMYFKRFRSALAEKGIYKNEDFLGMFRVKNVLEIKYRRFTKIELYPLDFDHNFRGYYYEKKDSELLQEIKKYKDAYDTNCDKYDKKEYKHFIFDNNKYWIEVIGTSVDFYKVKKKTDLISKWVDIERYIKKNIF
jgi:hypothetical protein